MRRNDPVKITLAIHRKTPAALLVSEDGKAINGVWIPKSQLSDYPPNFTSGDVYEITMPEWLAEERGFL